MSRSVQGRRRRANNVKARVVAPGPARFPKCTIIGCGKPTTGLAIALCRKHLLHRQRHGSPFCPSPTAAMLKPYLAAAARFTKSRRDDPFVKAALSALQDLLQFAGQVVPAANLRGMPPADRAKVAFARLREAGVKQERLLAIALAVHALIQQDPAKTHRIKDWRIVAIAKAAHRLASGDHRIWEVPDAAGRVVQRTEMHVYPRSSGRVLRYLGEAIEKQCDWVIERYLETAAATLPKPQRSEPSQDSRAPLARDIR